MVIYTLKGYLVIKIIMRCLNILFILFEKDLVLLLLLISRKDLIRNNTIYFKIQYLFISFIMKIIYSNFNKINFIALIDHTKVI